MDGNDRMVTTALFLVTNNIINECAEDLGLKDNQITDEIIEAVKDRANNTFTNWRDSLKNIIRDTIGHEMARKDDECPLHLTCTAACPFMQIGGCRLPNREQRKAR
jgi:hypothetical protein